MEDVPTFLGMWEGEEEVNGKGEMVREAGWGEVEEARERPRRRRVLTVSGRWRGLVTWMVVLAIDKEDNPFLGFFSTGSALIAAQSYIKKEGGQEGGGKAREKKEKDRSYLQITNKDGGGDVGNKEKGKGESKNGAKPSAGGFAGKAGDLKDAVVAEED